jgi:MFS family permease
VLAWQVPSTERSRAVTTVWGGLDVGSAVGLLLSGPLIRAYGWPSVFYLFAVLGGFWCLMWPLVRPSMQVSLPGRPAGQNLSSVSNCQPPLFWPLLRRATAHMDRAAQAEAVRQLVLPCLHPSSLPTPEAASTPPDSSSRSCQVC